MDSIPTSRLVTGLPLPASVCYNRAGIPLCASSRAQSKREFLPNMQFRAFFAGIFVAIVFLGDACYAVPHLAVHGVVNNIRHHSVGKRQAPVPGPTQIQCAIDKVNAAFGEDSPEASRCKAAADGNFLGNTEALQATINQGFQIFCTPECGKVILQAHSECGTFAMFNGTADFLVGLCAADKNGGKCYESYASALSLLAGTEAPCYYSLLQQNTCDANCQSRLQSAAKDQGCCMNVYHDFFASVANLDFPTLYSKCKVDVAAQCNNSPLKITG